MDKQEKLHNIRHSLAHLLASAVLEMFPKASLGVGPVIETGFYYDFLLPRPLTPDDLKKLEKRMRALVNEKLGFERQEMSTDEAKKFFEGLGQKFKVELIGDIEKFGTTKADEILNQDSGVKSAEIKNAAQVDKVSLYKTGKFIDLCRGGHVDNTSQIKSDAFKLDKVSGAYWRGDQKNPQMQRIYGLAFETKEDLEAHLKMIEEAKKRDHRILGKQLDLFTFSDLIGSGLPLYTPRGALIRGLLTGYIEELQSKAGYTQVWTPQIAKAELFKISGHYAKYKDDMFRVHSNYSEEEFYLKPMNCPQHTQIYKSQLRSYRDLPLRYTDFAMLYRDEKPGELNGLARVRSFSQDDCHVFCREDQVDVEVDKALSMTKKVLTTFGFKYKYRLSTRDKSHLEKYLGDPNTWNKVENWAEQIMKRNKIEYFDGPGEAAFYAPKMDLIATDALGREWQLSTVQIDFVMPERFGLTYIDKDGTEKHPVMIHRAIIGSPERFMMILLENYAGALPLWLSPIQISISPISRKQNAYAKKVLKELGVASSEFRIELDDRDESVGKKIREATLMKIPYQIILGEKEVKSKKVAIRTREGKDLGQMSLKKFVEKLQTEIEKKK